MNNGKISSVPVPPKRRKLTLLGANKDKERLLNEEAYDSDGCQGPFFDAIYDEITIDDEENLPIVEVLQTNVEEAKND